MTNVSSVVIVILGIFFVGLIILQFFGNVQEGAESSKFKVGDKVEANDGSGVYYPGSITKKNTDGTYYITFNAESGVSNGTYAETDIRNVVKGGKPDAAAATSVYKVGDKVEGNFLGEGTYYKGNISKVNADGTYNIKYTDGSGDTESNVSAKMIRKPTVKPDAAATTVKPDAAATTVKPDAAATTVKPDAAATTTEKPTSGAYKVGDKVEGNFQGEGTYYKGNISKVNADGTYNIKYTDGSGDTESNVSPKMIRKPSLKPDAAKGGKPDAAKTSSDNAVVVKHVSPVVINYSTL